MLGWIKLHRKIQEKGYYKKSQYIHLWVHLLLKANHKKAEIMFNDKLILIKEGQFVTGRKQLSQETGISESTIERILKMLENEHQIEQQKNTRFRLITIVNWTDYQQSEQQNGQQLDSQWTASGQPVDTNKNDKNNKNEENESMHTLWIKGFGRTPKVAEAEETQKLIDKFGYEKVLRIYKEASLKGFRNLATLIKALDDNGNIRSREEQIQDKPLKYEELIRLSPDEQRQYKLGCEDKLWHRK